MAFPGGNLDDRARRIAEESAQNLTGSASLRATNLGDYFRVKSRAKQSCVQIIHTPTKSACEWRETRSPAVISIQKFQCGRPKQNELFV